MPWRLILFIVVFAVFLVFITFNLDNRCDISFGVVVFPSVPVFLTVFASFFLGLLCTLPFIASAQKKRNEAEETTAKDFAAKDFAAKGFAAKGKQDDSSGDGDSLAARREKFLRTHGNKSDGTNDK